MRKLLKIGGGLLAVFVCLLAGVFLFLDPDQFRPAVQGQLESALNRKVTLGRMGLKLFPLAIRIEEPRIADDAGVPGNSPFLRSRLLLVRADLMALLRKRVQVHSVLIQEPVVELVKLRDGTWNFSTLGRKSAGTSSSSPPLSLDELKLESGTLAVTDLASGQPRAVYDGIDVSLRGISPGKPFQLDLGVRMPGGVRLETSLEARYDEQASLLDILRLDAALGGLKLSASGRAHLKSSPAALDLKVKTVNSSITELAGVAASFGAAFSPDMKVDGVLDADLAIAGPSSQPAVNGSIGLKQVVVNRKGWKQPVRIPAAQVQITPSEIRTNSFTVESGGTRISASASLKDYSSPKASIDATLTAEKADLGELLNVAMAYGISAADGISGSGVASLTVRLIGRIREVITYAGKGSLKDAVLNLPRMKKPARIANAGIRFEDDRVVIDGLSAAIGSSKLKGSLSIRNFSAPELRFEGDIDQLDVQEIQQLTEPAPPQPARKSNPSKMKGQGKLNIGKLSYDSLILNQVRAEIRLDGGVVRLDPLSAELFGGRQAAQLTIDSSQADTVYGVRAKLNQVDAGKLLSATTPIRQLLHGSLGADADLTLAPKPNEVFAKGVRGTFALRLSDGKLTGVSLMNEMANLAKLLGYRRQSEVVTNILKLSATLKLQDGVAATDDMRMEFDGGALAGAGTLNLADQSLNMRVTTVLAKAISDQFAGNKIGGILNSALTNGKGEIVIPSLVSGSAPKPVFTPDAKEIAKMRAQGISASVKDPAAMVGGVGGAIEAGRQGNVKGILDAISGRGNKESPPAAEAKPAGEEAATPVGVAPAEPAPKKSLGENIFDIFRNRKKKEEPNQP